MVKIVSAILFAGSYRQGLTPFELPISPDGAWRGKVGQAAASGTARVRGRQLIISGTARSATGHQDAVNLRLIGNDAARWVPRAPTSPAGVAARRTG
jgi:hypothetical protein